MHALPLPRCVGHQPRSAHISPVSPLKVALPCASLQVSPEEIKAAVAAAIQKEEAKLKEMR